VLFGEIVGGTIAAIAGVSAIASAGGYMLEKWNESIATIDMGSVDSKKPFSAPLEIKNPSAIFDMHSPAIACRFSATYSEGVFVPAGGTIDWQRLPTMSIPVKSPAIFFCDLPDKFTITNEAGKINTLASATMIVSLKYETWLPWAVDRQPPPTTFTLLNTSTGYQWVKGILIK
jgi:hypothetical protein